MHKFSISADFRGPSSSRSAALSHINVNPDAFLDRMERITVRRVGARSAVASPPQHPDAKLLLDREALDTAWRYEVATLIVQKRLNSPEADAIAHAARAATAQIAARIEAARAVTLDGLKAKARAFLWSRHGEPLEGYDFEDGAADEAETETSAFPG